MCQRQESSLEPLQAASNLAKAVQLGGTLQTSVLERARSPVFLRLRRKQVPPRHPWDLPCWAACPTIRTACRPRQAEKSVASVVDAVNVSSTQNNPFRRTANTAAEHNTLNRFRRTSREARLANEVLGRLSSDSLLLASLSLLLWRRVTRQKDYPSCEAGARDCLAVARSMLSLKPSHRS